MAFEVEAIFHFIAKNPPSLLLGGGILMYILGSLYLAIGKRP